MLLAVRVVLAARPGTWHTWPFQNLSRVMPAVLTWRSCMPLSAGLNFKSVHCCTPCRPLPADATVKNLPHATYLTPPSQRRGKGGRQVTLGSG